MNKMLTESRPNPHAPMSMTNQDQENMVLDSDSKFKSIIMTHISRPYFYYLGFVIFDKKCSLS